MRVLVTGCHGAVGCMVVRELLAYGDEPIGYDINADERFLADVRGQFVFERGDILDWPRLLEVQRRHGIQGIIHTAALLPDLATANPYAALQVNIVGTANLVELALHTGVRLVHTSTKGVLVNFTGEHGHPDYRPVSEDYPVIAPRNNHSLYDDTKVFCEHYLNRMEQLRKLDYIILRFAGMFGPGRLRHGGRAVLSQMIDVAMRGERYRLPHGGDQLSDTVYLRDVAYACVLGVHAPEPTGRTYHIGSASLMSYAEAAEIVRRVLPGADIEVGPGLNPYNIDHTPYCLLDISRARRELGYEPRYQFEKAVRDYISLLRQLDMATV